MPLQVELKILDPRLPGWGFPHYGSERAAGLDLHACIDAPLLLQPQAPAVLISAGIAFRIGDPEWCALVLPRSGLGHREGLVLGNAVGLIDPDYEGACLISAWNRNPARSGDRGRGDPDPARRPHRPAGIHAGGAAALHHRFRVRPRRGRSAEGGSRAVSARPASLPLVQTPRCEPK